MKFLQILTIIYIFSFISCSNFLDEGINEIWDEYDMYVLAIQWGVTLCKSKGSACYERAKAIPRHSMSIHGLWPNMASGSYLPDCNQGDEIEVIDDGSATFLEMRKYWPSLTGPNGDFWLHEYNKHGFCYNMKYEEDGENYGFYFQKVLDVFNQYKISSLITDIAGDGEDGEYVLPDDFVDKMNQRFGANTYSLRCTSVGGLYYLQEIRFRLDLDFNLTTKGKAQNNCPSGKAIHIEYFN